MTKVHQSANVYPYIISNKTKKMSEKLKTIPDQEDPNEKDFSAWEQEFATSSSTEEENNPNSTELIPDSPNKIIDFQTDRVAKIQETETEQFETESSELEDPTTGEADEPVDEETTEHSSKPAKTLDWVAEKMNNGANRVHNLADRIDNESKKEFALSALRGIGRAAIKQIKNISTKAKSIKTFLKYGKEDNPESDLVSDIIKDIAADAKKRWNERHNNETDPQEQVYEDSKQFEDDEKIEESEEMLGKAFFGHRPTSKELNLMPAEEKAAYNNALRKIKDRFYQNEINDVYEEAFEENNERNKAIELAEKTRHDAMIRARAANIRKIHRQQNRQEKINNGIDWTKSQTTRVGKALVNFAKGAGRIVKFTRSYIKGAAKSIHQAGVENARANINK